MPYFILFTSPTCAPCKMLKEQLSLQKLKPGISLAIADATEDPRTVEYRVRKVPVLVNADDTTITHVTDPKQILETLVGE